jgi:O-antigen/teichoic acid export membrane protein
VAIIEQQQHPTSRLVRNIVYNLIGQGTVLLVSFLAARFMFRRLGGDGFGVIYFNIFLTTVIIVVLDFGISTTTIREISRSSHTEPEYIRDLIRTASIFYWGCALLLAVGIYLGTPFLVEHWIQLGSMSPSIAIPALRVLGIAALVALPRVLYTSLFRGLQRMEFNNAIDVAAALLTQGGVVVILLLHGTLQDVAYWIALVALATIVTYMVMAARLFGPRALVPGYSREVVRRNWRFGLHMVAISSLSLAFTQGTQLILSRLLPIAQFGLYAWLNNLAARAAFVPGAIAQAAQPSLNRLVSPRQEEVFQAQYRKLQDLVSFGTAPIFALIPFATLPLVGYLFSPSVASSLLLPAAFLSLGFYMNAMLTLPFLVSLAVGRPDIATRANLAALFVVLPVTAVLVIRFGLAGAAFSWVFYHVFAYIVQIPPYCRECLHIPARVWYERLLRAAVLIAVSYGLSWVLLSLLGPRSLPILVLGYLAASIVYLVGAYLLIAPELRAAVRYRLTILRRWTPHPDPPPQGGREHLS